MGKLRGEKDIEATIQRLDRLTLDEVRVTAAQTLEVVCGLVQNKRAIMDGENLICPFLPLLHAECSHLQTQKGANRKLGSRVL
jgi:hypothetical protein